MTGAHRRIHGPNPDLCKLTDGQIASEDTRLALAVARACKAHLADLEKHTKPPVDFRSAVLRQKRKAS
jgi:hypothetical protein